MSQESQSCPLTISIRGEITHSDAAEQKIRKRADQLIKLDPSITACDVTIESPQHKQQHARIYKVTIRLMIPGEVLVANLDETADLYISIRDAFDNIRDQLISYRQQLRGDIKTHATVLQGKIVRLFDDFGFIASNTGEEYYFNTNNLTHAKFNQLKVGTLVRFIAAMGDEGPQAHRINTEKHNHTEE